MRKGVEKGNGLYKVPKAATTFMIKVAYSENFSVQGYIHWLEEGKSVPFRSYMELLHLIEEGLHIGRREMDRLRSWDLEKGLSENSVG